MGGLAGLQRFDVFLSFRGEDTRSGFTSHLHKALQQKHINVYMDHQHERAEHLDTILKKIEDAALSVIVFSKNFATSDFCLDEVVKIVECNERYGHKIFPVLYGVRHDDVTAQDGSYAKAIDDLRESAKKNGDKEMLAKVPNWRKALSTACSHTGLSSFKFKDDAEFVEKIVEDVSEKLREMSPNSESRNLVGMKDRIPKIESLLHVGTDDTRIISFCGIGGSGKTTLAKAAFNRFSPLFQNHCFLDNVTAKYLQTSSLDSLMLDLYSKLLRINLTSSVDLENENIRARLKRAKVLIVLDDVDDRAFVNKILLGGRGTFDSGSKIMITSRNNVFEEIADEIFPVNGLNDSESLELFSWHAFGKDSPLSNRMGQSVSVVDYCQNNPLALEVLGSALQNHTTDDEYWNDLLKDLGETKFEGIHKVLRVSYDRLNENQKKIFLDIACFFRGEDSGYLRKILEGCFRSVYLETNNLIKRSLISISHNKLEMHDLIQKMGWDIVEEESRANFNTGTRLWKPETVRDVLKKRMKGVEAIEGLFLDLSKTKKIEGECTAFTDMNNLRLLKFYVPGSVMDCADNLSFPDRLQYLPDKLRYLYWYGFPLECFPPRFSAEYLVELNLPNSKITRLWEGVQELQKLKRIDLRHSKYLTEFPDLREAKNVDRINLEGCTSLKELHSSIGSLKQLQYLNLSGCSGLEILPAKIASNELRILDLSRCPQIRRCPEVCGELLVLNLSWTAIRDLPRSFSNMKTIVLLDLMGSENLSASVRNLDSRDGLLHDRSRIYRDLLDWRW